jgi:nicotinate-nucleotide pyrophosphorylase (carboxylating)
MHRHKLKKEISDALIAVGVNPLDVTEVALRALHEDVDATGDITSKATIPADHVSTLELVARAPGVVAGVPVAAAVFEILSGNAVTIESLVSDGATVAAGTVILRVTGPTQSLLQAERPSLNLLSHLSGIATATNLWVREVAGTKAKIRDTRKTTPGLRFLEKYAVRCGGGVNHRMNLSDAALVKDNHVAAAGGVREAFELIKRNYPDVDVEVEVDSLEQLDEVVAAGADLVLLDNFTIEDMRKAVNAHGGKVALEASGGLTIATAQEVAATGVDYIAVGALTHSAPVLDIGADLRVEV